MLASLCALAVNCPAAGTNSPPNIVLILADDLGFSDLGCFGSEIPTPNLDRMASEGLRMTKFYTTPRCCPSRTALLTGLYPQQAGIGSMMEDRGLPGYRGELNHNCLTIAEELKRANYHTAMVGKWHLSHIYFDGKKQLNHESDEPFWDHKDGWPLQRGFEDFFGTIAEDSADEDQLAIMDQIIKRKTRPFEPDKFVDHYQAAVRELINEKLEGKLPEKAPERKPAQVINLMDALKRSLAEEEKAPEPASRRAAARSEREAAPPAKAAARGRKAEAPSGQRNLLLPVEGGRGRAAQAKEEREAPAEAPKRRRKAS